MPDHYAAKITSRDTAKVPSYGSESLQSAFRKKAEGLRDEAQRLAGAANKVANEIEEALEKGGSIQVQNQLNFMTGSLARIQKDWGALEYLQVVRNLVLKRKRPSK